MRLLFNEPSMLIRTKSCLDTRTGIRFFTSFRIGRRTVGGGSNWVNGVQVIHGDRLLLFGEDGR